MSSGDFGSLPFVAGSVFGHRVWKYQSGKLFSPMQSFEWTKGTQVAACPSGYAAHQKIMTKFLHELMPTGAAYRYHEKMSSRNGWVLHWSLTTLSKEALPDKTPEQDYEVEELVTVAADGSVLGRYKALAGYTVLDARTTPVFMDILEEVKKYPTHLDVCSCGFYAYFAGERNIFTGDSGGQEISGVIEGFGETMIGTKGFRCKKARVVALAPGGGFGGGWKPWAPGVTKSMAMRALQKTYPDAEIFNNVLHMWDKYPATLAADVLPNAGV